MQYFNALSLSPAVNHWLTDSDRPGILHVFDFACNLVNERREVLSMVTPQIGNGPFNLVIPDLRKSSESLLHSGVSGQTSEVFSDHINPQSPISFYDAQLIIGNLTINTSNAKIWSPRPDWELLHSKRDNILDQIIRLPVAICRPLLPNSLISNLSSALAIANISSSLAITSQLAGLGNGLTPAGDDILLGAIYAVWIIHPLEQAQAIAEAMAGTASPLTTSLSGAWLRSAGKGEAGILWHNLFAALISTDTMAIEESLNGLLAVGHTSGADALTGFINLFMCWAGGI